MATSADRPASPPLLHSRLPPYPPHPLRRIAVCADDFGIHAGVNLAVWELAGLARVNAIACLVGGPAWAAGHRLLKRLDGSPIDIGLHLDLTEFPLIARSRRSLPALVTSACLGLVNRKLLRAEICAQFDAFEQALGRSPAFVDGHRHVHQLPVVRRVLLEELGCRGAAARPWLRCTRQAAAGGGGWPAGLAQRLKPRVVEALGAAALSRLAAARGHLQNQHLLGLYDFTGGRQRWLELLRGWLAMAVDGDLLMCHPSMQVRVHDPILAARTAEYEVLAGPRFVAALDEACVRLGPMSQLLSGAEPRRGKSAGAAVPSSASCGVPQRQLEGDRP